MSQSIHHAFSTLFLLVHNSHKENHLESMFVSRILNRGSAPIGRRIAIVSREDVSP